MERIQLYAMSVKFTKEQMTEMEKILKKFYAKNNIELVIPVDIFEVADFLGFDVRGAEFKESLDGILLVDETSERIEGFNSNKVIAYNCFKNIYMKKFIVAHELAHYISAKSEKNRRKVVLATREHKGEYSGNIDEQKMDYMAASILMPRDDLIKTFGGKNIEETELINLIVSRYKVSSEMAKRRIEEVLNENEKFN